MEFRYEHNDTVYVVSIEPRPDKKYAVTIQNSTYVVEANRLPTGALSLNVDDTRLEAYAAEDSAGTHFVAVRHQVVRSAVLTAVTSALRQRTVSSAVVGRITAQMPGLVLSVDVQQGDTVEKGQSLLVLEAMKMEIRIQAPTSGKVTAVHVAQGQAVERGDDLIEVLPDV